MYNKVDTNLNFVDREKNVEKFWKDNDIFRKSMDSRKEGETYTFYDGPPTANGKPHIGHVLTRVIKDMIPRYRTMKGYMVPRKAGWDTHGLPVELEVEKLLGLNGKDQIEAYGMEPFIKKCKEIVWKYKGRSARQSFGLRSLARTRTSSHGRRHRGHCRQTWLSASTPTRRTVK